MALPDGQLLVVSRDLRRAVPATGIASSLRAALETLERGEPRLQALSDALNRGSMRRGFRLPEHGLACAAAAQLAVAGRLGVPQPWRSDGARVQTCADRGEAHAAADVPGWLGRLPRPDAEDMPMPSEADGIDFEAEIAVVVDRVPMGTAPAEALSHVKLVMLANDASLRSLAIVEMKTGFGWVHAKPATSFSPVAVTPDELGAAWKNGRVCLPVQVSWNGREFGHPDGGAMGFGFHELIAHAAYSRNLSAGTIIGSGTVSNSDYQYRGVGLHRRAARDRDRGSGQGPHRNTCASAIGSGSKCSMRRARASFGAIDQRSGAGAPGRAALRAGGSDHRGQRDRSSRASTPHVPAASRRAARFPRGARSSRRPCGIVRYRRSVKR